MRNSTYVFVGSECGGKRGTGMMGEGSDGLMRGVTSAIEREEASPSKTNSIKYSSRCWHALKMTYLNNSEYRIFGTSYSSSSKSDFRRFVRLHP